MTNILKQSVYMASKLFFQINYSILKDRIICCNISLKSIPECGLEQNVKSLMKGKSVVVKFKKIDGQ